MNKKIVNVIAGTVLLVAAPLSAEDIDLFINPPAGAVTSPNVLFVLDNSANWNATQYRASDTNKAITKKNIIHQALYQVVTSSELTDAVRVGYMTFSRGDGGKVMSAVQDLTATHQAELAAKIFGARVWQPNTAFALGDYVVPTSPNGLYYIVSVAGTTGASEPVWPTSSGDTVTDGATFKAVGDLDSSVEKIESYNNAPYALTLHEAYLYYKGDAPREGTADGDHDAAAVSSGQYVSPAADSCAKNFIILIGNGSPDSSENNTAESLLTSLGGKLDDDPIPLNPDNYASNWSDEYARFLSGSDVVDTKDDDQNIITYVINVVDQEQIKTAPDRAAEAFLKSIAKQGDGRHFYAKTVEDVALAILEILEEIKAVNSVFASTTLPVSVNVRGTNLNQVYMGVFRPDRNALPRWVGNLKLYKLAVDTSTNSLYLADKNGNAAESPITGFIVSNAVSYWTTPSTFWSFHGEYAPSDSPDGEVVEKGAVAQNLRESASRNLYTCTGSCGAGDALSGTPFTTSNTDITQAALGAADAAERDNIINWVRGTDLFDEDSDAATNDLRASIHGDVLHSRPAVINYNRNGSNTLADGSVVRDEDDIIAFYGANDGVFRAVYGGKDDGDDGDAGDANDGDEIWGFIPEEFFPELKTLYDNGTAITAAGGYKPYFADGHIGVYLHDGNPDTDDPSNKVYGDDLSADKVYLYISMRRGGRFIYALNVTDPTNPKLLWKRRSSDTGFGELGQTWSEPKVATINLGGSATPVLIFGAGYDPVAEDADPQGTATMGRGIFVVNAETGNLIWQAGPSGSDTAGFEPVADMTYPIPSNVTVLDTDGNGYVDRVYVGDTGGQVWRVNLGDTNSANWSVVKLAAIADHSTASGYRKFLYAPDVVYDQGYDAVLIGSGNREDPGDTTVVNRFYMFKDTGSTTTITESDLYDATDNLIQDGTETEQATAEAALNATTNRGWYITLRTGEKVVSSAVTLSGSTFFNTNQPLLSSTTSCVASLGTARNYIVSFKDASATTELNSVEGLTVGDRSGTVVGGGYPPSPVPVIVEIDGKKYQAVVSGTKVLTPPNVQLERREKIYWYKPE